MAREFFTYRCGCEGKAFAGSRKEAESKASYLSGKDCFKCGAKAEAEVASKQAEAKGLPALTGSEKQITWAEQIRAKQIDRIETFYDYYAPKCTSPEVLKALDQAVAEFKSETSASKWIDGRDSDVADAIVKRMQAIVKP